MSSFLETAKKDLKNVKQYWTSLPENIKWLDLLTVVQVVLFIASYLVFTILKSLQPIPTNSALVIFPIAVAGFTFVMRLRISNDSETTRSATREFLLFLTMLVVLVLITVIYGIILESVIT